MSDKTFGFTKQQVRLMDVFIVAPFLFYSATKTPNNTIKYGLIGLGALTLLYNATNYIKQKNAETPSI
jgi:hypothetical protein